MKYLKYCESNTIGTRDEQSFLGKIEGQPKHGPTIICFKNPNTLATHSVYTGKNIYIEDVSPIQYNWRYEESYNGHPVIIVNFSRIDAPYNNCAVCLESNNMSKGTGTNSSMSSNKYNLKGENNNRALNVFTSRGWINDDTKNITWYRLGDIELNRDYPIYITVPERYITKAKYMVGNIPNDWEVRINVRPTIRGVAYKTITNSITFMHTNKIPAKEYISVKFPYINIYEL